MSVRPLVAAVVVCSLSALARAAPGEAPAPAADDPQLYHCKQASGEVVVSFKTELEVQELVAWAMGFTCRDIVLDPRIVSARKVTIMAPNKLSRADAWRLFQTALRTIRYAVIKRGRTLVVVDSAAARGEALPLTRSPEATDQLVRTLYQPTYVEADALLPAFTALKSEAGDLQRLGGMLLVTDYGGQIAAMLDLAKLIDVPHGSDAIYLVPVHHADATKLVDKLTALVATPAPPAHAPGKPGAAPAAGPAPAASKILVDERTNTLIVAASEAGYQRVKALVDRLDLPLDVEGGASFHVYKLGSAIAEELAQTLTAALGSPTAPTAARGPRRPGTAPAARAPAAPAAPPIEVEGEVRVIADKPTNSLIVVSSGRDFLAIQDLIRSLDVPRRQVYIETAILEVSVGSSLDLGASGHVTVPGGDGVVLGGVQLPDLSSTDLRSLAAASGALGALIGPDLAGSQSLLGQSIPSYAMLFQALAGNGRTNVISTPSILGVDNKESKHTVGVDIPYERGQVQGFGANPGAVQTLIDHKKLEHQLKITPHISANDDILLEIVHSAEELGEPDVKGPVWNTRGVETTVVVHDQQTIVIGGLMQERVVRSEVKVPLLGDLPIVGYLFKRTRTQKRKTNLLILLTPYIIKDQLDLQRIQERKLREHQELAGSLAWLGRAPYTPHLDYGRKRGLVEEINRTVLGIEQDLAERAALHAAPQVQPGRVD